MDHASARIPPAKPISTVQLLPVFWKLNVALPAGTARCVPGVIAFHGWRKIRENGVAAREMVRAVSHPASEV